jgi:hypothetical protein
MPTNQVEPSTQLLFVAFGSLATRATFFRVLYVKDSHHCYLRVHKILAVFSEAQ